MQAFKKSFLLLLAVALVAQARVLVVVNSAYYQSTTGKQKVDRYVSALAGVEYKVAEVATFTPVTSGSVRARCFPLWTLIRDRYSAYRGSADSLEGVVLVGNLPVAEMELEITVNGTDTIFSTTPVEYYWMDMWNAKTGAVYASDLDAWNTRVDRNGNTCFESWRSGNAYRWSAADSKLEIWVSRIMGHTFRHVRKGTTVLTEYDIINDYFDRLNDRMTRPAKVPSRSFTASSITEWGTAGDSTFGDRVVMLDKLKLPFHHGFYHPYDSPANFVAQLQFGNKGGTNRGAFNGVRNPAGGPWEASSVYGQLYNVTTRQQTSALDNLGYEWVGVYNHGCDRGFWFNGTANGGPLNGEMMSYRFSPIITNSHKVNGSGGVNNEYYRFRNADFPSPLAFPEWGPIWSGKTANWRTKLATAGAYDISVYYRSDAANSDTIPMEVRQLRVNNHGSPWSIGKDTINQRAHASGVSGWAWEPIGRYQFSSSSSYYDSAWISMEFNGDNRGYFVIDAVKLTGVAGTATAGLVITIDNSSAGFTFNDWQARSYMDMQDEDESGHAQYNKACFFIANSCHLFQFTSTNNFGALMSLTQNGLAGIGVSGLGRGGETYEAFIGEAQNGSTFGRAFLAQANAKFGGGVSGGSWHEYVLLGAGTLRTSTYYSYGSQILENMTISNAQTLSYATPVYLRNFTVTATGNLTLSSTKEIVVRPVSRLAGTTTLRIN